MPNRHTDGRCFLLQCITGVPKRVTDEEEVAGGKGVTNRFRQISQSVPGSVFRGRRWESDVR